MQKREQSWAAGMAGDQQQSKQGRARTVRRAGRENDARWTGQIRLPMTALAACQRGTLVVPAPSLANSVRYGAVEGAKAPGRAGRGKEPGHLRLAHGRTSASRPACSAQGGCAPHTFPNACSPCAAQGRLMVLPAAWRAVADGSTAHTAAASHQVDATVSATPRKAAGAAPEVEARAAALRRASRRLPTLIKHPRAHARTCVAQPSPAHC